MGCCLSGAADKDVPATIDTWLYGEAQAKMTLGRWFSYDSGLTISQPHVPVNPADPQFAKVKSRWQGLELSHRWTSTAAGIEIMGLEGEEWGKIAGQWLNGALLGPSAEHLVCGREEVLCVVITKVSACAEAKKTAFVVLSTGRMLLLSGQNDPAPHLVRAFHIFDLGSIAAAQAGEDWQVKLTFQAAPASSNVPASSLSSYALEHVASAEQDLLLTQKQATELIHQLSRLTAVFATQALKTEIPQELRSKVKIPQTPCDGGFLSFFWATLSYLGVSMRSINVGQDYFASVPLLELNISQMDLSASVAVAVRTGLQRAPCLRGFVCSGKPNSKKRLQKDVLDALLPIFKQGTLLKVDMAWCIMEPAQLEQILEALSAPGACRTGSLDLSGSPISEAAAESLAKLVKGVPGGMQNLTLESCELDNDLAKIILTPLRSNSGKLERLNLANNTIGTLPDPHPLATIWKSKKMEVLNLMNTQMNIDKILEHATRSQVAHLRELKLEKCLFPPKEVVTRFFGHLGASLEEVGITGFVASNADKSALFTALAQKPSPSLFYTYNMDNYDLLMKELVEPLALLEKGLQGGGIRLGAKNCANQTMPLYDDMCRETAEAFKIVFGKGLKGAAANAEVWQQVAAKLRSKESAMECVAACKKLLQVVKGLGVRKLEFLPMSDAKNLHIFCVTANGMLDQRSSCSVQKVGFGPALALAMEGLSANKEVWQLDVSNAVGGDSLALALGSMLKANRTLQSLQVEGNYFTHLGWTAVRGALYGNKKLLEFQFPEKEAKDMVKVYQEFIEKKEREVLSCRANIKRAYKSTKGKRTPHVMQTQEREVKNICAHKQEASQAKQAIQKYGAVQQEIQQAISRNQKETKSQQARQKRNVKDCKSAWAAAGRAFGIMEGLQKQKKANQEANAAAVWQKRNELTSAWVQKKAALQKKGKDVKWLEGWLKANTKEGGDAGAHKRIIITHQAASALLMSLPPSIADDVKPEIKLTKEFIAFEQEFEAKQQQLNSQLAEQRLVIAEVQNSPNFVPPPTGTPAANLTPEQANQLQGTKLSGVKPPPLVMEAKVVGVGDAPSGPVVQGTVVKSSPAMQQAEYDQFVLYQKEQEQMRRRLQQQRSLATRQSDPYRSPDYYGGGYYGYGYDPAFAYLGYYQYGWHTHHYHDPYVYSHYDHYGWQEDHHFEVESGVATECQFAYDYGGTECLDPWDGIPDSPPEGMEGTGGEAEASPEDLADAGEAVEMYAGGEDDRPGGGPHFGGWRTKCLSSPPAPPRLDLAEWFEEHIRQAEEDAKSAVLGRTGRLPYRREVLLRTGRKVRQEPGLCLVTQCSMDRLARLRDQLCSWSGEVSAAIFIDEAPGSEAAAQARRGIREMCFQAAAERRTGDAPAWTIVLLYRLEDEHVKCEAYDRLYPVNALRNAALEHARSELVFLLDVDFVPSRRLHGVLSGDDAGRRLLNALTHGSRKKRGPGALVIPAFESAHSNLTLPIEGSDLRVAVARGEVEGFHVTHFPCGHRATDFERWLGVESKAGSPEAGDFNKAAHGLDAYLVKYEEHFEPYVVVARSAVPAYDERFRGYGLNKISHLYELGQRGFHFRTCAHADAFVVAAKHPKSQSWRLVLGPEAEATQRARIATHYAMFKAELQQKLQLLPKVPVKSMKARELPRRGLPEKTLFSGSAHLQKTLLEGQPLLAVEV